MPASNAVLSARGRLARASRGTGDPQSIEAARRDLAVAKLERYVAETVQSAPPLTPEQCDRIAALLQPANGGGLHG